jgi:hypothetical protein
MLQLSVNVALLHTVVMVVDVRVRVARHVAQKVVVMDAVRRAASLVAHAPSVVHKQPLRQRKLLFE